MAGVCLVNPLTALFACLIVWSGGASFAEAGQAPSILIIGDSLTAGYGVGEEEAFPALLGRRLTAAGYDVEVVNAGVSGDTTAGGLHRLDWLLRQEPDILVVGLGGNDGLRGLPLGVTEMNLRDIVRRGRDAGADILLLGMLMPPNYGPEYTDGFAAVYPRVASEEGVELVPFLLAGVGGRPELNQPDGIHPTAAGHEIVADNVFEKLRALVEKRSATGS